MQEIEKGEGEKIRAAENVLDLTKAFDRANAVKEEAAARAATPAGFAGKKNIYTCDKCFGHIVTVDVDQGVTPFMLKCRATLFCDGVMQSSMYRVFDQRMKAAFEWYRPCVLELVPENARDHVAKGGLLLREAGAA